MNQTIQDKDFLEDYDISQYDRPSIAADIAVFSIGRKTAEGSDYRRLPTNAAAAVDQARRAAFYGRVGASGRLYAEGGIHTGDGKA